MTFKSYVNNYANIPHLIESSLLLYLIGCSHMLAHELDHAFITFQLIIKCVRCHNPDWDHHEGNLKVLKIEVGAVTFSNILLRDGPLMIWGGASGREFALNFFFPRQLAVELPGC